MAITRMRTEFGKPYDPSEELTNSERRRFSEVANKIEERKEQTELYKALFYPKKAQEDALLKAKQQPAHMNKLKEKYSKSAFLRSFWRSSQLLVLFSTLGAFWMWVLATSFLIINFYVDPRHESHGITRY